MDKNELLDMPRCALINCDNIRALGSVGIDIVKMQIQSAIDMLDGKEEEDRRVGHHRTSEGEAGV